MRTRVLTILSLTLLISVLQPTGTSHAASIAGKACSKLGATKQVSQVKYTCVKTSKGLRWNSGVRVAPVKLRAESGFFNSTYGCGNKVLLSAFLKSGVVEAERAVIQAPSDLILTPISAKAKPDRLLIRADSCVGARPALYELHVGAERAIKLPAIEPGWSLIDAGYDPARDNALALIFDGYGTYKVILRTGLTWMPIWQSSLSTLRGRFTRLFPQTGYEFYLGGYSGMNWVITRVMEDGYAYTLHSSVGTLSNLSSSILDSVHAISTTSGIWICDLYEAKVDILLSPTACPKVTNDYSRFNVFTFGVDDYSFWFVYATDVYFGRIKKMLIRCDGGLQLFRCVRPVSSTPQDLMEYREGLTWFWLGEMDFYKLRPAELSDF